MSKNTIQMKKAIKQVKVDQISPYNLDRTLGEIKVYIDELIGAYGADARFDWNPNFYYDYDNSPSPIFNVIIDREETDEEFAARCKKEEERANEVNAQERAEFERLSAKFGKVK